MSPPIDPIDAWIRDQLVKYNDIFKSRGDVLDHMFFVLGSGYCWKGGELIEDVPEVPETEEPIWRQSQKLKERYDREKEEATHQIGTRATDITIRCPYPVCEEVPFFEVPDDVQFSYLQAALEIGTVRLVEDPDDRIKVQLVKLFGMLKEKQTQVSP